MRAPINNVNSLRLRVSGVLVEPNHPVFGYDIEKDNLTIANEEQRSKIVFKRPVSLGNQLIEVSYLTLQPYCLKCNGTGKVSDYKRASSGSLLHVTGLEKLAQRSLKFVLTSRCPFYPSLTTQVKNFVGRKFGVSISEEEVNYEVTQALQKLKQIQLAQRDVQHLDPQEILKDIVSIEAVRDKADPSIIRVSIRVSSYAKQGNANLKFAMRSRKYACLFQV
jgi:hypothetical protein